MSELVNLAPFLFVSLFEIPSDSWQLAELIKEEFDRGNSPPDSEVRFKEEEKNKGKTPRNSIHSFPCLKSRWISGMRPLRDRNQILLGE